MSDQTSGQVSRSRNQEGNQSAALGSQESVQPGSSQQGAHLGGAGLSPRRLPDQQELREKLTPLQYEVTKHQATEPPFRNEYWDNHREGLYVDIISGEPLFSSLEKFDSACGWPSFTKPLNETIIEERRDTTHGMIRTEVRSKNADSHLGHVFPDGPVETGGLRYCINSAAMRFIPKEDLEREGYGEYLKLFEGSRE